jgi:hypothetical protein
MILKSDIDIENKIFTCVVPTNKILDMQLVGPNLNHPFYSIVKTIIKNKGYSLKLDVYPEGSKKYIKSIDFKGNNTILEFYIHLNHDKR